MTQFLEQNWQALATLIGTIIIWFNKKPLARWTLKNEEVNHQSNVIDSLEKAMAMYTAMLDDIETRHAAQLAKRDAEIKELTLEVKLLKETLEKYLKEAKK